MTKEETIADIIAKRATARAALSAAYYQLDRQMQDIIEQAGGEPPTAEEKKKMDALAAGMTAVTNALKILALATQDALNANRAARRLANRLEGINKVLEAEKDELEEVAATVDEISDAIAKVDKVLKGVIALLPLII